VQALHLHHVSTLASAVAPGVVPGEAPEKGLRCDVPDLKLRVISSAGTRDLVVVYVVPPDQANVYMACVSIR
jgi:hypothetical protein